ncbi:MAG: hypothetical protein WCX63_06900, partial [Methanoregula sp.]
FGGDLKARRFLIQKKEIALKLIVGNIHRFLQFLVIEVFYRAELITLSGGEQPEFVPRYYQQIQSNNFLVTPWHAFSIIPVYGR